MSNRSRAALTVAVGIVFATLVFAHVPYVNGPDYWPWRWQRNPAFPLLALAAVPAFVAQRVRARWLAVLLLSVTVIALQFTANAVQPRIRGVARIDRVERDQLEMSYFTVAESIAAAGDFDWLGQFDEILRRAPQHATTKPPGPIGFYIAMIRLTGPARAPLAVAIAISLLSACAVAATWWMVRTLGGDDEAARQAATLLALAPSMTVFFLYLDPIYPILSCAMMAVWFRAVERESRRDAALFGALLFAATMITYSLLVLGAPLVAMTFARSRRRTFELVAIALGVAVALHVVFTIATGFNPISAFRTAVAMQAYQLPMLHRPWPKSIPFDILDFFLGAGWVAVVPAVFWMAKHRDTTRWMFATPFVVALTGLLRTETARVWIFLLPLLFFPAGLELRTWSAKQRAAVHATMAIVLIALYANMEFVRLR